ncbi:hypothetical protein [Pseudogemmobacter sonorensis]|uniref:hypothetical protein n=1 Tax=Pseudogemmobacter sonorensis TaxID=2989681 RepID=UPI0036956847
MKRRDKKSHSYITACSITICFLVLVAAGAGFLREYRAAVFLRGSYTETLLDMRQFDPESAPQTARSLRELLMHCAYVIPRNAALRLNESLQQEVSARCAAIARAVLARSPASARARAMALIATPQISAGDYRLAQAAAPFEPWPLGTRLLAAERLAATGADLPDALTRAIGEDAANGLRSIWGRELLAGIWLREESLRDVILAAAETRPPEEQRAFLQILRSGASDG